MTTITYGEVNVFDFETTGLDVTKDRPIQIGMSRGLDNPVTVLNELVNPQRKIDPEASKIHKIYDKDLIGKPGFYPILCRMAESLHKQINPKADGTCVVPILCGFNTSQFDIPMADACLGQKFFSTYPQIDVLDVVYRYYPDLPHKKQVELYEHFFGVPLTGAHGAIEDCYASAGILNYILSDIGRTCADLVEELKVHQVYKVMPIGKHRGKKIHEVPKGWATWMRTHAEDMRPDLQMTVDTILEG